MKCISNDELAYEAWLEKYRPIANIFPTATGAFDGMLFETFGPELIKVRQIADVYPQKVWTLVECDGVGYISAGYHLVNRLGYFITSESFDAANPPADLVAYDSEGCPDCGASTENGELCNGCASSQRVRETYRG